MTPKRLFQQFQRRKKKKDEVEEMGKMDYSSQLLAKDRVISNMTSCEMSSYSV